MGMAGSLQSRADPGSSSGSVIVGRVVLGKTLLPSGMSFIMEKPVSLPRWAGAPREAVSWAVLGRGHTEGGDGKVPAARGTQG